MTTWKLGDKISNTKPFITYGRAPRKTQWPTGTVFTVLRVDDREIGVEAMSPTGIMLIDGRHGDFVGFARAS